MLHVIALGVALTGPVPAAIERSIHERMGDVRVSVVQVEGGERLSGARLKATPEPGSRLGRPVRFILAADGARVGSVVARLDVTGSAVRSTRALSRGEDVGTDAVEVVDVELKDMLLGRLPTTKDIVGAQARRDIRAGEILTDAAVIVPPVVKSGDEVRVSVSTGVD